ncbi:hypothetical protein U1Q18_019464 [Sarracenia purpurea var. burkii]
MKYRDGRVGDELEWADDEKEHAHDVAVAAKGLGVREFDFGLDFVGVDFGIEELEKDIEGGEEGENEEEEEDVVAEEEVVRFGGGVIEPECFRRGQRSAQGGLRFLDGSVGQH